MYVKPQEGGTNVARTRNIKPAFFDNDTLGSLEPLTRLLFIGLWCIADREGRLEDRPRRIKKTLLGYDDVTAEETSGMLQQLADTGFIIRYETDGVAYIQVVNFSKHQNPNQKEKDSEIPPPPGFEDYTKAQYKHSASTVQAQCKESGEKGEAPEKDKESVLEMRFNAFWDAYPNKKAKQNAVKAWKKINPNAALFEKIMKAIELQKNSEEWLKENGRFIPHPATWLNGGRWEDEITERTTQQTGRQGNRNSTDTMGVLGSIVAEEEGGVYDDTL